MTPLLRFGLIISLLFAVSSCEQLLIEKDPANTPTNNFELLWKEVNQRYTFFEYKKIDWNAIYQKYRPQIKDSMTERELFSVMAAMMNELRDGHTNLQSDFDVSRSWDWYLDYPANFNANIIERNYLGKNYEIAGPFKNRLLPNDMAYIQYESFMGISDAEQLGKLIQKYQSVKSIIIDIRDNTGGALAMVDVIAQFFVPQDFTVGYERYKKSAKSGDFTDYFAYQIKKHESISYKGKVVLLTNRKVYSAANWFASVMSELPNVTLIGDQTGGGGGAPFSGELMNGWKYRFSGTQLVNLKKEQIESGVVPDIKVDMKKEDEAAGKDTILETAIAYLK